MLKWILAVVMAVAYILAVYDAVAVRNVPIWKIVFGSLMFVLICAGFIVAIKVSLWRHRQSRIGEIEREEADNYF